MPSVGTGCHELRVRDEGRSWRIVYRPDADAIVILDVFAKTSGRTPRRIIETCRQRLRRCDSIGRE